MGLVWVRWSDLGLEYGVWRLVLHDEGDDVLGLRQLGPLLLPDL